MLFQLGDYKFEGLKLPLNWGINFATNYAQIPIIGGKPVVQKLGEKLVEHDLFVLFSDEFCKPQDEVKALQLYRRNGNVLQLTGGDGINYGKYVITDIAIVNERADQTGYISAISASLKLLEYNASSMTVQTGEALGNVTAMEPLTQTVSPSMSIANDIANGQLKAQSIKSNSTALTVKYHKIMSLCDDAKTYYDSANAKINNSKKIYTRSVQLQQSIAEVQSAIKQVKEASQIKDLSSLLSANNDLDSALYQLKGANAPLAAFVASREART